MLADNVVELNARSVYKDIMAYLDETEDNSRMSLKKEKKSSTRKTYEPAIRQFFNVMRNKDIEHLDVEDLQFRRNDIIRYRKYLIDLGLKNTTINKKLSAIKSLYANLKANDYDLNIDIFKIKRLADDSESYGKLSQTEGERFAEAALRIERFRPRMKYLLIMFAIRTSFRLDEILNVTWDDFEYNEKEGLCLVSVVGKRNKKNTQPITENLYNQILELKEENKQYKWDRGEIVFQISEASVNNMMKRLREFLSIPDERNIVFHSFRGIAIDHALSTSGDIRVAAKQGNHSNINTTMRYVSKNIDYSQSPGITMENKIDLSFLDEMTLEDFKEFIQQGNYKLQLDAMNFFSRKMSRTNVLNSEKQK